MVRSLRVAAATGALAGVLGVAVATLDPQGVAFAFVVVWAPMTWLGTVSRWLPPRLPRWWYRLRPAEADGRLHERLGVRVAKAALRRGPLAAFNPHLHLPADRSPEALAALARRMEVAEASHVLAGLLGLAVAAHAAARGWWAATAWTLAFDLVLNGYPALLQRYNRALLARRYPTGDGGAVSGR